MAVLGAALLAGGLVTAAPGHAACAGSRTVTGTLAGEDGRAVNVYVGMDIKDSAGRAIGADGCVKTVGGYGRSFSLNSSAPATGASSGQTTFSVQLPTNATDLFVEAYPKNPQGRTDVTRYGRSMRRLSSVGGPIAMKLPVRCDQGGSTSRLVGTAYDNGQPVTLGTTSMFSISPDNGNSLRPILGWGYLEASGTTFASEPLVPGQNYRVFASSGSQRKTFDVTVPKGCVDQSLRFAFRGSVPPPPPPPPPPPASVGAASAPATFHPVTPVRILDTRDAGDGPALGPAGTRDLVVAGKDGVPANATAVVLNVTGVFPSGGTDLRVYPTPSSGNAVPNASNLNVRGQSIRAVQVVAKLGAGGAVRLRNAAGTSHVVVDLAGWFGPDASGAGYVPLTPTRRLDTRTAPASPVVSRSASAAAPPSTSP